MPDMANATVAEVTGKIMVAAIIILFLVLILMSFLHLYEKWFWWRTEEEEEEDATNYPAREAGRRRRFVFTPGQDQTVKRGLKPSVLRSLPVLVIDCNDGLECAVCLCELVEGEKARMLPKCNHGFHVDCIDMWFESHSTCPLCRNLVVIGHESGAQMAALEDGVQNVVDVELINVLTLVRYPTNVLFWGNEVEVNTGGIGGEEGSNVAPTTSLASRLDEFTDPNVFENSSSSSQEQKSPLPTRLRTLKRLYLSRDKRVLPSSSSCSVDLEQGMSRS